MHDQLQAEQRDEKDEDLNDIFLEFFISLCKILMSPLCTVCNANKLKPN